MAFLLHVFSWYAIMMHFCVVFYIQGATTGEQNQSGLLQNLIHSIPTNIRANFLQENDLICEEIDAEISMKQQNSDNSKQTLPIKIPPSSRADEKNSKSGQKRKSSSPTDKASCDSPSKRVCNESPVFDSPSSLSSDSCPTVSNPCIEKQLDEKLALELCIESRELGSIMSSYVNNIKMLDLMSEKDLKILNEPACIPVIQHNLDRLSIKPFLQEDKEYNEWISKILKYPQAFVLIMKRASTTFFFSRMALSLPINTMPIKNMSIKLLSRVIRTRSFHLNPNESQALCQNFLSRIRLSCSENSYPTEFLNDTHLLFSDPLLWTVCKPYMFQKDKMSQDFALENFILHARHLLFWVNYLMYRIEYPDGRKFAYTIDEEREFKLAFKKFPRALLKLSKFAGKNKNEELDKIIKDAKARFALCLEKYIKLHD